MTKTELAAIEIASIVTFEHDVLESPIVKHGFAASIEDNKDGTFYLYVDRWGILEIVKYDFSNGTREHAIASLRKLASRMGLRVIGGIE